MMPTPVPTTVINTHVFDGEQTRPWTSVRFAGGLITHCGPSTQAHAGDEVIDAKGATLLPGLIDAHMHLLPGALQQSLVFGVSTVLDMFSTPQTVKAAKATAVHADAADVRSAGIGATTPGGHPSLLYPPFPTLSAADGQRRAREFVAQRAAEGCDYLKVVAEADRSGTVGAAGTAGLGTTMITALTAAAHTRGLKVVAHATSAAAVAQVLAAGVDVIAHVPAREVLDERLIERIAAAGTAVCPTLATAENTLGRRGDTAVADDPHLAPYLGPGWLERLRAPALPAGDGRMGSYETARANVVRLVAAGVAVLAGTDAAVPRTVYGASLHRELELLAECGLRPAQVLQAATAAPADVFGLCDRGRVRVGLIADLVLVGGDVLADIVGTRAIRKVWRGGVECDRGAFAGSAAESEQLSALVSLDSRIKQVMAQVGGTSRWR